MHVRLYQGFIVCKIVIGCIKTKVGVSNGGTRHVDKVNNLLEEKGGVVVRIDVVNGGSGMGEKKSEMHCLFNQRFDESHDHKQTIRNRSKNDHRTNNQKPIKTIIE